MGQCVRMRWLTKIQTDIYPGENIFLKISEISLKITLNLSYISLFSEKVSFFSELKNPALIERRLIF